MKLRDSCIRSLNRLNRSVRVHLNLIDMRGTVAFHLAFFLGHCLRMVYEITLSLEYECRMMVIARRAEPYAWVAEYFPCIRVRPHRVVAHHVADGSCPRIAIFIGRREVGTIGVVILTVVLEDAAVLKHTRRVNHLCLIALNMDHVVRQLSDPCRLRIQALPLRHAAAEEDIAVALVIHQHSRVKAPYHALALRISVSQQRFAVRILPGS